MPKVNLKPNENSRQSASKRKSNDNEGQEQKRSRIEDEDVVDYGEDEPQVPTETAPTSEKVPQEAQQAQMTPEEAERLRITSQLERWCRNNISSDKDDPEAEDRVAALAEVGLLLVLEIEKYPNADSMRTELADIGSIIGGDQIVTRYINFILSLQNQLKKNRVIAERQMRQQQQMMQQAFAFPHHGMMPMMIHPGGPHMFVPHHQMYMALNGGFPMPAAGGQPVPGQGRGNMTFSATGELTEAQKRREKERKRKEILAECTEHLKALLERVTKTTDQTEKAKIYELIDKVKKRIESLKEAPAAPPAAVYKANAPKGPIRGYYGNQYVNPQLLEKQRAESQQAAPQEGTQE